MKMQRARLSRKGFRSPADLPLFAFAADSPSNGQSMSFPALILSRRFGLSPQRAVLIAELAGMEPRLWLDDPERAR